MNSSRNAGAVGKDPVTLRVVKQFIRPGMKVLDFGAGQFARHANALRAQGFDVTAHDYTIKPGIHDPKALDRGRKYDMVYSSNVLNVQHSPSHLNRTVQTIANATHPQGTYIANFASGPHYDAYKGLVGRQKVELVQNTLMKHFGEVTKLPMPHGAHVWACKKPRV
jgi:hypothetical protein